jgi:hypothetical protein
MADPTFTTREALNARIDDLQAIRRQAVETERTVLAVCATLEIANLLKSHAHLLEMDDDR